MSKTSKELLRNYVNEQNFSTSDDVLNAIKEMFRDVLQEVLEAEMNLHLGYDKNDLSEKETANRRNGYSSKTVKSELGPIKIDVPRNRNGEFEPKIVSKYQRNINGIEEKVTALYAAGMTIRDISEQIKNLYGVDIK